MTSKCGKNKKVAHEAVTECGTDVLTTFWRLLWSITESDARQHGIYLFYIRTKQITIHKAFVYFKIFQHNAKAGLRKKAIWRNLWSIQNEAISSVTMRGKELWLVEKVHATVKPASSVASLGMKPSTNFEKKAGKIKSVFVIGAALWAEKLWRCLENCRSWKSTLSILSLG